jgi:hypothetical protein
MPPATDKILINSGPSQRGWHRCELFLICPQLYAWRYHTNLLDKKSQYLVRGAIGHTGLAHHYARMQQRQQKQDPDLFYTPAEGMALTASTFGALGAEMLPITRRTVEEYITEHACEEWRVLHVEKEFTTELSDSSGRKTLFTMRPDLIVEALGGGMRTKWILDHKFVSTVSKASTRYTNSGQFLALQHLGRALYGKDFGGVIVNGLQVAPHCKFRRIPVDPSPYRLRRFPSDVLDAEEQIVRLEASGRAADEWPAAPSEHTCVGPYGACDAYQLCRWGIE